MLVSDRVEGAFHAIAREQFVPDTLERGGLVAVYRDEAIITKRDEQGLPVSSSSQPAIMAKMLELLDVNEGDNVLEIGAGTGYNAALLKHLAGPSGRVTSIDIDPVIARRAGAALRGIGTPASVVAGDGRHGHPDRAPYDRIIVTASASEIAPAWLDQVREAGRLVVPLRLDQDGASIQLIPAFERHRSMLRSTEMTWGGFMPLHDGDGGHQRPQANLSVVHTIKDRHTALATLTGAGIGRLTEQSARELLISLLDRPVAPRRSGTTNLNRGMPPSLLIYLMLNIPADRRLSLRHRGRWGIGLVNRQSIAIVSLPSPWSASSDPSSRVRWRMDAYGANHAATELEQLLDQWQQLERDPQTALQINTRRTDKTVRLLFTWYQSEN